MQFNIFRNLSAPTLRTRRVSSSIFRGGERTSGSRFNPENLNRNIEFNQNGIIESLKETNKILVEIQKQLAYDFAMRIAEEKEAIKKAKKIESKRKFTAKEKSIEGTKKLGSFAENIVDRVTAPIKSVFDRIKEFFGLVIAGIVTNAVFTWLGNPENRKKLNTIFDWVGNIFVGLLLGVITFKFIKWSIRLFKLVRFFWRLPGKIKALFDGLRGIIRGIGKRLGLKPKSDPTSRTSPGRRRTTTPRSRPRPMGAAPRPAPPSPLLGPSGTPIRSADPLSPYRGAGASRGRAPYVPPKIQVPKKQFRPFNFKGGNIARGGLSALAFFALDLFMPQIQDGISKLYESVGIGIRKMSDQELLDEYKKSTESTDTKNILLREIKRRGLEPPQYSKGGTIKASNGMTVPGRGSKNVDSVHAMLAPGEEVIRTSSAMMFRPLLKDINDNAGRLWDSFSRAIGKLASVSEYQKEVSKEYSKVIKDFDEYLKQEINKKKTKTPSGGGGTRRPKISTEKVKSQPQINTKVSFSSQQTNVKILSSPKITNVNMTPPPSSGGGMTFLPMVLPTQKSKPPQIPTPQNTATDVPFITSVNMSNPYMQLTPEMYGIFV